MTTNKYPRTREIMSCVTDAVNEPIRERAYALMDAARAAIEQLEDAATPPLSAGGEIDPAREADRLKLWHEFAVHGGPQGPFMLYPGFRDALRKVCGDKSVTPPRAGTSVRKTGAIGISTSLPAPYECAACGKSFVWVNKIPDPRCSCGGEIVSARIDSAVVQGSNGPNVCERDENREGGGRGE